MRVGIVNRVIENITEVKDSLWEDYIQDYERDIDTSLTKQEIEQPSVSVCFNPIQNHRAYRMLESITKAQNEYLHNKNENDRKSLGQYFTTDIVAKFMASFIELKENKTIRILDAGGGFGILTIASALQCVNLGSKEIHSVIYEIDKDVASQLKANLVEASRCLNKKGVKFTFDLRISDFILSRPDKVDKPYHLSVINPPYFKYNCKSSIYSGATKDLFKGDPNIYASFMSVVGECLDKDGQMIAIVPRSFTNGLYFKGFRHYLNRHFSIDKIHIFRSRNNVFKELSVLQENVICSYFKKPQSKITVVSASNGFEDLHEAQQNSYKSKTLIDISNDHQIIRIPESIRDAEILDMVEGWQSSFKKNGYSISTGPVVEHRTKEYIVNPYTKNSVPLLRMHNIKSFKTIWTGDHRKDVSFVLSDGHSKHTSPNKPYIILKRFSTKDEKRRLTAGVYNPEAFKHDFIGLENHLNYISLQDGNISIQEAYGLSVLLNSTIMDKYFRCISGNTQVNATEIRILKLPKRETIISLGRDFMKKNKTDQKSIDILVSLHLKIKDMKHHD